MLACAFHPELTDDPRLHALFMAMTTSARRARAREEAESVRDPRAESLAKILVGYSTKVKEGEVVSIDGESAAEPLLLAVYEEVLKAGAHPILNVALDGQSAAYFKHASDAQLDWISPVAEWMVENVDVRIAIGASTNTRELSAVPPERQTPRQAATGELMARAMERSAEGEFRWCYTLYPTSAYASEAEMSLADYEDFYFGACLADDGDPLTAWKRASSETERLAEWIEGHEEVRVTAPGTDITLGIAGRKFIPCDGDHNMPDGEFFTGPVEDSVEGEVTFHLPAVIGGPRGLRRAAALRGGQGRRRQRRARRGVPDQAARHRRRAPAASASSGSAPTTRSTAAPARSCSTRRSAAPSTWRSAQLSRVGRRQRVRRPHRPRLRPAPRRQARSRRRGHAGRRQVRRLALKPAGGALSVERFLDTLRWTSVDGDLIGVCCDKIPDIQPDKGCDAVATDLADRLEHASERVDLDQARPGRVLDANPRTIARWLHRQSSPRPDSRERVLDLLAVLDQLSGVLQAHAAHDWLFSPNPMLDHYKPVDLLRDGD